ncbi:hypothetical protein ACFFQF_32775 [Haladaptatus pallidirubidus]|uniref:hypothetical protein n=1 Tax=Haladaptatus pallidirubidus TaxID=1008152 RepID=UPI0035EA0D9A
MAERVPGVTYKESRTLCMDDAMGLGRHHIEITFAHPDLAGGCEHTKPTREGTEGANYSIVITGFEEPHFGGTTTRDSHRTAGDTRWY